MTNDSILFGINPGFYDSNGSAIWRNLCLGYGFAEVYDARSHGGWLYIDATTPLAWILDRVQDRTQVAPKNAYDVLELCKHEILRGHYVGRLLDYLTRGQRTEWEGWIKRQVELHALPIVS